MSLSSTNNRNDYTGTGALDEYDYTFKIFREQDLLVTVRDTDGIEETLVLNTDYTVDGVGDVGGGTITLLDGDLADDYVLTIRRVLELKQSTDIRNQGPYFPVLHENQFDKHVMIAQQQQDEIDRSMRLPETVSASDVDTTLPLPVAGRTIGWNDDADGLANFANAGDLEVSAFIETVLDDTTSVIARDTLRTRGIIHVGDYGAVGDGTTDDSAAITSAIAAALAAGKVLYGAAGKTYRIESNVNFRFIAVDFSECNILVVGTAVRAIIGGNAASTPNPTQKFKEISRSGGANSNPTCRVIGAKGQQIHVDYCDYLDLYADTSTGNNATDYSIAYSTFYFNHITKLVLTNNASTDGSSVQWINENTFYLKRTTTLVIEGTYPHNHNYFHTGAFESATITITAGISNIFPSLRAETSLAISCAAGTYANVFVVSYIGTALVDARDESPATFTDTSGRNYCKKLVHAHQRRIPIVAVSPATCKSFTNSTTTTKANYTTLKGVDVQAYGIRKFVRQSFALVYDCPFIPVSIGDLFTFSADATIFRYVVRLYNSSFVLMTESTDASIASYLECDSGLAWNNSTDAYEMSANSASMSVAVVNSAVAYIKFEIRTGGSVSSTPFTRFGLQLISKSPSSSAFYQVPGNVYQNASVTSSPTRGFCEEIGEKVSNSAGGWFTCTFTSDTTLNGAEAAAQTVVTVTTVTGIASGDVVGLELDDGSTHWTTVNGSPAGSDVTLTDALPSGAASGNRIVFNRWTAT